MHEALQNSKASVLILHFTLDWRNFVTKRILWAIAVERFCVSLQLKTQKFALFLTICAHSFPNFWTVGVLLWGEDIRNIPWGIFQAKTGYSAPFPGHPSGQFLLFISSCCIASLVFQCNMIISIFDEYLDSEVLTPGSKCLSQLTICQ